MASYNRIILVGNLTRDPELRYAASGTAICSFGMAMNHKHKDQEEVCFLDVTTFGRQAETATEYLKKGQQALVEGRMSQRSWEAQDGQRRTKYEVIADRVVFLGAKGQVKGSDPMPVPPRTVNVVEDDDIPF